MCCSVALLSLVGRRSAWMQMPHLNDSFHMLRSLASGSAESASHHEPKDPSSNPSPALPQLWRWKQTLGFLFSAWEIRVRLHNGFHLFYNNPSQSVQMKFLEKTNRFGSISQSVWCEWIGLMSDRPAGFFLVGCVWDAPKVLRGFEIVLGKGLCKLHP